MVKILNFQAECTKITIDILKCFLRVRNLILALESSVKMLKKLSYSWLINHFKTRRRRQKGAG